MAFRLKKLANVVKALVEVPGRLLYPEVCQICFVSAASPSNGYICRDCQGGVSSIKPPFCHQCGLPYDGDVQQQFQCPNCHDIRFHFVSARSACVANTLMLDLLHRYKYKNARWLDPFFERLLGDAVSNEAVNDVWDAIIPVPLHPVRQRERGYNQSVFLAESLGVRLKLPCFDGAVKRIAHTPSQTMLSRKDRAVNVSKAFEVVDVDRIHNRRILLIDDVFTTGATVNECARVCLLAGVESVHVWTLARGLGVISP